MLNEESEECLRVCRYTVGSERERELAAPMSSKERHT